MNQVAKLKPLEKAPFFTINTVKSLFEAKDNSLFSNVVRWENDEVLLRLMRGTYTTRAFYSNLDTVSKNSYPEFLSNRLCQPSYLSMEYVLQKASILTESVFSYTAITLKTKRVIRNKFGNFIYYGIKKELFTGFRIENRGVFEVAVATKAKALFDYLYLKLYRTPKITKALVESFRLNLLEITDKDLQEFGYYCNLSGQEKYMFLLTILKELKDGY
ncbi:MAG: hypothetical protein ACD_22C00009G0006 [uncultured bacterium]|uniref:AbiEi antitoxin C-terminal domain-containing protein n=1 Tax=candidate division WWE3 bacterium RBG_16_37_10 TaxID=1802610 RepID=A0A1F4V348_UNCKA|nr:MAG: hypothetical protein ACD_22C00009G0006 [uncultured bacterium]OGC51490.1 MAG: hypothetical protein A2W32_02515 [candidate division WWE3 bacterium RBG_16_37_10]